MPRETDAPAAAAAGTLPVERHGYVTQSAAYRLDLPAALEDVLERCSLALWKAVELIDYTRADAAGPATGATVLRERERLPALIQSALDALATVRRDLMLARQRLGGVPPVPVGIATDCAHVAAVGLAGAINGAAWPASADYEAMRAGRVPRDEWAIIRPRLIDFPAFDFAALSSQMRAEALAAATVAPRASASGSVPTVADDDATLTVGAAATFAGVSASRVTKWCDERPPLFRCVGKGKHRRINRADFTRFDVDRRAKRQRPRPGMA